MPRVEENNEMIQSISRARLKSQDSAALIAVLSDISKSLAVIADALNLPIFKEGKEDNNV